MCAMTIMAVQMNENLTLHPPPQETTCLGTVDSISDKDMWIVYWPFLGQSPPENW